MRQKLIWAAIVFGAVFYIVSFLVGEDTWLGQRLHLSDIDVGMSRSVNIVATIALGLGIVNLLHVHGGNILRRRKEWPLSVVVFVTFGVVTGFLLWEAPLAAQRNALELRTQDAMLAYRSAAAIVDPVERDHAFGTLTRQQMELVHEYYDYHGSYHFMPKTFYLNSFINPLAQTVMALLGFYITYAAYRAFRIRSFEATIMMLSAAVVVLGTDAVGGWLSNGINALLGGAKIIDLPFWADVDNRVLNSGMQRGLAIGISIAIISASLRMLMGLEKGVIEVRSGGD